MHKTDYTTLTRSGHNDLASHLSAVTFFPRDKNWDMSEQRSIIVIVQIIFNFQFVYLISIL